MLGLSAEMIFTHTFPTRNVFVKVLKLVFASDSWKPC